MLSSEDIKMLRRVRSAAVAFIRELDGLNLDQAPEKPRKRENLKEARKDRFATNYAMGTWRKPAALRRTK